ncbi:hypothetical protein ACLOJK_003838, partial [Asimina triloba]
MAHEPFPTPILQEHILSSSTKRKLDSLLRHHSGHWRSRWTPSQSLMEPVRMIASDAEGPITRAEFGTLTELLRVLQQQLAHSWQQQPASRAPSDTLQSEPFIILTPSPPGEPLAA